MNKQKGRRSQKKKGKYKDQFFITARNKARRQAKREKVARLRAEKKDSVTV